MAYLWVKDREVAQDLLQTVFEKSWRYQEQLQNMENPTGWLVRSLRNESLQHFRKTQRIEPLGNLDPEATESEGEERMEEVKRVFVFLESLPEKQREIFQLREVEGLTYEEIAEYLDISMEQVKVNLHRARKALRNYLTQYVHER